MPKFDSPIEDAFWKAHLANQVTELAGLTPQHRVFGGQYRIDFAIPAKKIGIELDGWEHHHDRDVFAKDIERQRALEMDGWRIVRFSGREVHRDARACVLHAALYVRKVTQTAAAPVPGLVLPAPASTPGVWPIPRSFPTAATSA